ncbi:hypothetical protein C8R45DRAFT_925008 [Mycena sanguinolenta]|nr:hypothetical protein C8R45DRAFT_925008 [Mycena sanguinolenta]
MAAFLLPDRCTLELKRTIMVQHPSNLNIYNNIPRIRSVSNGPWVSRITSVQTHQQPCSDVEREPVTAQIVHDPNRMLYIREVQATRDKEPEKLGSQDKEQPIGVLVSPSKEGMKARPEQRDDESTAGSSPITK